MLNLGAGAREGKGTLNVPSRDVCLILNGVLPGGDSFLLGPDGDRESASIGVGLNG